MDSFNSNGFILLKSIVSDAEIERVSKSLILHSSGKASKPEHRRVLHIEYAAIDLPGGLQWSEASLLDCVDPNY